MAPQFSPRGERILAGEPSKAAAETRAAIREGKAGRPMRPSGTVKTARWKYGKTKSAAKKAEAEKKEGGKKK